MRINCRVWVRETGQCASEFMLHGRAQAACDRLNLLAVLEALREPSEGMDSAGHKAGLDRFGSPTAIWRAMIDAAIKEAAERRAVNAGETE